MYEKITLNGHTLVNYLYGMHEKKASKKLFFIFNRLNVYFFVRKTSLPFLIVDRGLINYSKGS